MKNISSMEIYNKYNKSCKEEKITCKKRLAYIYQIFDNNYKIKFLH